MTHGQLVRAIVDKARTLGLLAHACCDSKRCIGAPGLPDVFILGERGGLLAEVKTGSGQTTPWQDLWAWTASRAGIRHAIWHESDWRDGTVETILQSLR